MKLNWKILLLVLFGLILAVIFLSLFWAVKTLKAPNETLKENVLIEVKDGESSAQVATDLGYNGFKNTWVFKDYARITGRRMNPGFYEIAPNMSMVEVLDLIDESKTKLVRVTIPEGWRAEQIGKKLSQEKILSYDDFILEAQKNEGKLFPDTYFFNPRMSAAEVVKMMTDDYQKRTSALNVSDHDLVLASIVEREAANDADRAMIAGIYSNRLQKGMNLESDPTVEYGRDTLNIASHSSSAVLDYTFWKSAKTVEYTSVKSPFNTYQINGLPPAPICDPGLASIKAALSPEASSYYYFLYGKDGKLYPSKTLLEHQTLAAKYLY